jgi:hypothetical protein
MAWVQAFLDFVKNIAWPVVVLTLAFCFRRDLHYLANRVTIAGPSGVEFDPQRQLTIPPLTPGELKEFQALPGQRSWESSRRAAQTTAAVRR